jgi:hypothetical protein
MSNGPQFFETRMGMKFYDGTMPRIAEALQDIAAAFKTPGSLRARGLPVPVSLGLLDDIVTHLDYVARSTRSEDVEEVELAKALLARIEKETK